MSWAGRLSAVVMVIGAMAIGQAITSAVDVSGDSYPPFVSTGAVGDVVALPYADVEVTDVRPAQYLASEVSSDLASRAGGVYVVVSATLTASEEPVVLRSGWLEGADGTRYRASAKSRCTTLLDAPTGVPLHTLWCFDVPPDELAGLRFLVARGSIRDPGDEDIDGDAVAEVDLGISGAEARTWAGTTAAYRAVPYAFEPIELREITLNEAPS